MHSQPSTLPRRPLSYAILRLHQEAVWMKLALYENAPQSKIPKGQNAFSSMTIDILIDTGAALSLIREDIITHWKELTPRIYSYKTPVIRLKLVVEANSK